MLRTYRYLILPLVLALMLSACEPQLPASPPVINETTTLSPGTPMPEPEPSVAEPGTLRINLGAFPDVVDPQRSSDVDEIAILKMVYEGLTRLDGDLHTVPAAAELWEYNEDATQLVFTLRDGLTYSDGSPLNAARFEYSFHRSIDPVTASANAFAIEDILSAAEWHTCTKDCDALRDALFESTRASHADGSDCTGYDDAACNTFTLKFKQPAPYFHTIASLWVWYPAKQELIEAGGENWWLDPANQIGNGPFVMTNLEQGVSVHLAPNVNYWHTPPSYELDYSFIVDSAAAIEAFKNDELDIINGAVEDLATIQSDPDLSQQYMNYPGSCTYAVMFHQLKEPFTDPAVRQAFAYALDREGWVTDVLQGFGFPTLTWIPKGFPAYQEGESRFGYDPEKAVQTLTGAGYAVENGRLVKDGKVIEITDTFNDTPHNRSRNEWLVAKWKEVLGLDIPLKPVEPTTFTSLVKDIATSPQMFIFGWCAKYPDPHNWLSVWKTEAAGFGERIGFSNPEIDDVLARADAELDPAKRADLCKQAQEMLVEGSYVAFLWNTINSYLVQPWVQGITQTPMDTDWPGSLVPTSITIEAH